MNFMIKDVVEKNAGEVKAPSLPRVARAGFPAPKKRISAFKALRAGKLNDQPSRPAPSQKTVTPSPAPQRTSQRAASKPVATGFSDEAERRRISAENDAYLANMSPEELARERDELLSRLSGNTIETLMRRANLDKEQQDDQSKVFDMLGPPSGQPSGPPQEPPEIKVEDTTAATIEAVTKPEGQRAIKTATEDDGNSNAQTKKNNNRKPKRDPQPDAFAPEQPVDIPFTLGGSHGHHMKPDNIPELDPNDPNFLESMQKKYFPNLSADPSQLAWMAPIPTENSQVDRESPYYPGQDSLSVSALRFDFRGRMLSPRKSREIPVTKGLHHHGEAPEAAGYTISELAIYARSAVPMQRCVAFQTLGRILYRLGMGDWGVDDLANAIWTGMLEGRVLDSLAEAGSREGGHLSSQAYAAEALWLFEQGGWREKRRDFERGGDSVGEVFRGEG
ncbi:RNA polymerase II-associated protein RBA50 [Zalerion maritima]|uniref:RNA polymerase II-associated protein RBA50 n=1 Tax=Zalerion maritima TaxID=339359 RepID=A0AAD5RJE0_9PEZI|nr:RNA polymerase II-associated protein RBA50 [Zalerion maritima]